MPPRLLLLTTAHSYRNEAFRTAAAAAGVEVVVAYDLPPTVRGGSPPPPSAGQGAWLGVDLADPRAATAAVAAVAAQAPLAAVLPVDDSGVVAAAAVAAQLNLPYNAPTAAAAARDKHLMRTLMAAAGVPCPWFERFSTGDDPAAVAAAVPYPCVLKPTGLNGSRGVMRADTPGEFVARASRLAHFLAREYGPGPQPYLVEAFIPGFEVALEGILDPPAAAPAAGAQRLHTETDGSKGDGGAAAPQLTVLALFDKPDPLDGPFFEETIYVTPSRLPAATQAAIAAAVTKAAAAMGLRTGPIHAELRVNEDGPWLLEIAGRSIGGLCGRTLRFGLEGQGRMTLEELIVRQACGLPWRAAAEPRAGQAASGVMMIPIPEAGQLRAVAGVAAAEAVDGIEGVEISVGLHHTVTPLPEGESYLGFIFARGATPAAVEASLRAAHAALRFTIVPEIELGP